MQQYSGLRDSKIWAVVKNKPSRPVWRWHWQLVQSFLARWLLKTIWWMIYLFQVYSMCHTVVTYYGISVFLEKINDSKEQHMSKNLCLNEKWQWHPTIMLKLILRQVRMSIIQTFGFQSWKAAWLLPKKQNVWTTVFWNQWYCASEIHPVEATVNLFIFNLKMLSVTDYIASNNRMTVKNESEKIW